MHAMQRGSKAPSAMLSISSSWFVISAQISQPPAGPHPAVGLIGSALGLGRESRAVVDAVQGLQEQRAQQQVQQYLNLKY